MRSNQWLVKAGMCFVLLLIGLFSLRAQSSFTLHLHWVNETPANSKYQTSFADSTKALQYLEQRVKQWKQEGYISFSIDSTAITQNSLSVWAYAGKRYRWRSVHFTDSSLQLLAGAGLTAPNMSSEKNEWDYDMYLNFFANNGYPFAKVKLTDVVIDTNAATISGKISIDPGTLYRVDSIEQIGPLKLKPYFLYRYLNLAKGAPYNAAQLSKTDITLSALPFARLRAPSRVQMLASGSVLQVDLQSKRSNIINVLIGAMPNSSQTPNNKLQITGDVNLQLRNAFGHGEMMGLNWQQIQYKSPRIVLQYEQPYLFQSRFGASLYFELFRKDSQFLNLRYKAGIPIQVSATKRVHLFLNGQSTTVTNTDTLQILASYKLPDLANMALNQLEIRLDDDVTNNPQNPRRGWRYSAGFAAGLKRITPDNAILNLKDPANPDFDFGSLYDTIETNSYQLRFTAEVNRFLPIGNAGTVLVKVKAAWLQSPAYYRNELFQIGGFQLLRGFDEESIFSKGYMVGTAEYRLLTGNNGYFYGFTDAGWSQLPDGADRINKGFWGLGLGLRAEANNTLINIAVAAGRQSGETFDLRRTKIHLGIINYF